MSADDFLLKAYRPRIKATFEEHPDFETIMKHYDEGTATPTMWDIWYADMELMFWEKLRESQGKSVKNGDTVRFEVFKDENEAQELRAE